MFLFWRIARQLHPVLVYSILLSVSRKLLDCLSLRVVGFFVVSCVAVLRIEAGVSLHSLCDFSGHLGFSICPCKSILVNGYEIANLTNVYSQRAVLDLVDAKRVGLFSGCFSKRFFCSRFGLSPF